MYIYSKKLGLKKIKKNANPENIDLLVKKYDGIIVKTIPSVKTMEKWNNQGYSMTPCKCKIEVDGECKHGNKSWTSILLGI